MNDPHLSLEVLFAKTGITKVGPLILIRESECSWKAEENVEVCVPSTPCLGLWIHTYYRNTNVQCCTAGVMLEQAGQGHIQLGSAELTTEHLFTLCAGPLNGMLPRFSS